MKNYCKKTIKFFILLIINLVCVSVIYVCEINIIPFWGTVAGIILGLSIPKCFEFLQDLYDTTNWKTSQRKLHRGKIITNKTRIRISFAYLFRIKVGNKYLLVKNARNTGKYQPVGGVYKMNEEEKNTLNDLYGAIDDDKIEIDKSSKNDYRLRIENKFLRKFVKRFCKEDGVRENIKNLSREFKEELIDNGLINWNCITYKVCGRHFTDVKYSDYFQCYELLLADVVELKLTEEQENDLIKLMNKGISSNYYFATSKEIECLGINTEKGELKEIIGDHSKKILQENQRNLRKISESGKVYSINI